MFFIGFTCRVDSAGYEVRTIESGEELKGTAFDTGPEVCLVPCGGDTRLHPLNFETDLVFVELANANTPDLAVAFANRFGMLDGVPDPPLEDFFFRVQRSFAAALQGQDSTATLEVVAEIVRTRMGQRSFVPSLGSLSTELHINKGKKAEIRFRARTLLQFALIQLVNSHAGLDNIRQCAAPGCGLFFSAKGVTKKLRFCSNAHKSAWWRSEKPDRVGAINQKKRHARLLDRGSSGTSNAKT